MSTKKPLNNKLFAYLALLAAIFFSFYLIKFEIDNNKYQLKPINQQIKLVENKKIKIKKITLINPSQLSESTLFGTLPLANNISSKTKLPLKLMGIFENKKNPSESSVIISIDDQKPKVIILGRAITPEAILYKILPEKIIIKNGNQHEYLFLEKIN